MANIFCRSPFIIEIDEANQIETKVELYIWNGTGAAPALPTYKISKIIPSLSNRATYYNISPFIKEFLSHPDFENTYNISNDSLNTLEWCNVVVRKFKKLTNTFSQVGADLNYYAFDGYTLYSDGVNKDLGNFLLDQKTYYYYYDPSAVLASEPLKRGGTLSWVAKDGQKIRWTELVTGTIVNATITQDQIINTYRIHPNHYDNGNLMEILDASNNVLWSATFRPKTECQYTPVVCDFINKYGGWQREWFFKRTTNNIEVTNSEYNLLQNVLVNYSVLEGQQKVFNTAYKETITVNTDWVKEDFSENIRQLMTSERILLDNRPVKINTKSTELFKQIDTKMINYTLTFEYAHDMINSVV